MSKIIPLISSGVAGPLGVLHLPRLWQKALLAATGKQHPDYPAGAPGYDTMVLEALGLEPAVFFEFINTRKPTYVELEQWVLDQKGGSLDAQVVQTLNDAIRGYNHRDEVRTEVLKFVGRADDGSVKDAVTLNNLDDWQAFYAAEIG